MFNKTELRTNPLLTQADTKGLNPKNFITSNIRNVLQEQNHNIEVKKICQMH